MQLYRVSVKGCVKECSRQPPSFVDGNANKMIDSTTAANAFGSCLVEFSRLHNRIAKSLLLCMGQRYLCQIGQPRIAELALSLAKLHLLFHTRFCTHGGNYEAIG
jgi:hypothetical protein